jgi:hypothetical protein
MKFSKTAITERKGKILGGAPNNLTATEFTLSLSLHQNKMKKKNNKIAVTYRATNLYNRNVSSSSVRKLFICYIFYGYRLFSSPVLKDNITFTKKANM